MRRIAVAGCVSLAIGAGGAIAQTAPATIRTQEATIRAVTVAEGLETPWGMAFLPDGRILVTERPGRMRVVTPAGPNGGQVAPPLGNVPKVFDSGQGGLLDVTLDPDFARNRILYFTYAEPGQNEQRGGAGTALASAVFDETSLSDVKVLFRQQPKVSGGLHFGSRVVVGADGRLWLGLGERYRRDEAQNLNSHLGKVIRIEKDGRVPADNPFVGRNDVRPEIWSYGHRNIQGMTRHPQTGLVWLHEHGAQGGDEINIPDRGRNYGWPVITHGIDYSGAKIGIGTAAPGMEQPLLHWTPSIAPSGMAFYTGSRIPAWRGNLFVGSLKFGTLHRVVLEGTRVVRQEQMLKQIGDNIRDVRDGPDGFLYLATDSPQGRILRLEPAD
jgi:glucose/arabinose dehydrogenase